MRLTLHQLQVFATVAKYKNITQAAEHLFLTQPAVSNLIKQLEDIIGSPVLEIIGKKIYITAIGNLVEKTYYEIKNSLDTLEVNINQLQGCIKGNLNIAMVSTAKYFIPKIVGQFQQLHPHINIQLQIATQQDVNKAIDVNTCNFAILSELPLDNNYHLQKFAKNPLVIICHPTHALSKKRNINISDLKNERWLVREAGSGIRLETEKLLRAHTIQPNFTMELSSTEAIKQAVMANMGIALVPKLSLAMELALKLVDILQVKHFPIEKEWYLVYPKTKKLTSIANEFINYLLKNF